MARNSRRGVPGVRLDRALSKRGLASRAEAKALIVAGRVSVDAHVVTDPSHLIIPETARIAIDGAAARPVVWRTVALHKPRGVVTTRRDPEGRRTVFDLLGDNGRSLVAVGRLDLASSGLLLLTTDTQLANYLTDPANAVVRRYVVTVRGELTDDAARRMVTGIAGLQATAVKVLKRSKRETHITVELIEGRNREIRRMMEALGHEVTRLLRVRFGPIELGDLAPGKWREVSKSELSRG